MKVHWYHQLGGVSKKKEVSFRKKMKVLLGIKFNSKDTRLCCHLVSCTCDGNRENCHRRDDSIEKEWVLCFQLWEAPTFKIFLLPIGGKAQSLKKAKKKNWPH